MSRKLRIALAGTVGCLLTAVACTDDDSEASRQPSSPPTSASAPPSQRPATPQPSTPAQAFAINIRRDALDLEPRHAAALLAGQRLTWAELGQVGGPVRIATGDDALAQVEQDPQAIAVVDVDALEPTVQVATVDGIDPVRSPRAYAVGDAPDPLPEVTTMTIAGDIMLGRRVGAASPGDPGAALEPMSRYLARADLTIGNLESTLSRAGNPTQGDDSFAADPRVLTALHRAGFDLLSLANNHTGDYGERALVQTVARLDDSPIERVGAGRDYAGAWRPAILDHDGVSFGFLAFNAIGETPRATAAAPGAAEIRMQPRTGPLSATDLDRAVSKVKRLKGATDVVIVLSHWGDQYTHVPVQDQRRVGAALIDAGADLVVGGHPHWVQGIQTRGDSLIMHSLGNFIFDMDFQVQTQEGVTMELTFWGDRLMQARLVPYVIGPDFAPRRVTGERGRAILNDVWRASDAPFSR